MMHPKWISLPAVYAVHNSLLCEHGGSAGVRDQTLLEAAIHRPINKFHFGETKPDMFTLAAAYCFAIIKAHAFIDGNKRTGYMIAVMFLVKNNTPHNPDLKEAFSIVLQVADSTMSEDVLAGWFRAQAE